jgi:hypothetical protein
MSNDPMQAAFKDLQDSLVVMAHIEKRQSEQLNDLLEFRNRTERNLAEMTGISKPDGTEFGRNHRQAQWTDRLC